jgi:hypothetical protein
VLVDGVEPAIICCRTAPLSLLRHVYGDGDGAGTRRTCTSNSFM